jgi:hypothetical protein
MYLTVGVKPVFKGHLRDKEQIVFEDRGSLKRGSIHIKFCLTGHEKGDLLLKVNALLR